MIEFQSFKGRGKYYVSEITKNVATPDQLDFIRANNDGNMSIKGMAKALGVKDWKILKWMKDNGIVKVRTMPGVSHEPDIDNNGMFCHDKSYFF